MTRREISNWCDLTEITWIKYRYLLTTKLRLMLLMSAAFLDFCGKLLNKRNGFNQNESNHSPRFLVVHSYLRKKNQAEASDVPVAFTNAAIDCSKADVSCCNESEPCLFERSPTTLVFLCFFIISSIWNSFKIQSRSNCKNQIVPS